MAALNRHWRKHPPLQLMVQQYLGIKPKDEARSAPSFSSDKSESGNTETDLRDFMQMFSAAGGSVG